MIAGGKKTKPTTKNPSSHSIKRAEKKPGYETIKIKTARVNRAADGKLTVTWENDPATLPQFAYSISLHSNRSAKGKALAQAQSATPHARSAELKLPENAPKGALYLRLECDDILGNTSKAKTVTVRK